MATATERTNFIATVAPLIQAEAKKRGYKVCSPVIAQACCEGNFGQSSLAKIYNNHFGLKCGSYWNGPSVNLKTKEEYTPGQLVSIRDNFRVFPDLQSGIIGYYDFINTKRYENLKTSSTPEEYCRNLKADGYATSSTYESTLLSYIANYGLRKYDFGNNIPVCPYKRYSTIMKKGSRGESVKWLQWWLNRYGYGLVEDGIFGKKTEYAVENFQMKHNLTVDRIVGKYTIYALENSI